MWGRNANVQEYFPAWAGFAVAGINQVFFRFMSDSRQGELYYEPRYADLEMYLITPGESSTKTWFPSWLWDVMGYQRWWAPSDTIEALAAALRAKRVKTETASWDWTVCMDAGAISAFPNSDLPNTVLYLDADGALTAIPGQHGDEVESGVSMRFSYHLYNNHTNFKLWPQAVVWYLIWDNGIPTYCPSPAAGVFHTIHTQLSHTCR